MRSNSVIFKLPCRIGNVDHIEEICTNDRSDRVAKNSSHNTWAWHCSQSSLATQCTFDGCECQNPTCIQYCYLPTPLTMLVRDTGGNLSTRSYRATSVRKYSGANRLTGTIPTMTVSTPRATRRAVTLQYTDDGSISPTFGFSEHERKLTWSASIIEIALEIVYYINNILE